jgi:hypothetical protein
MKALRVHDPRDLRIDDIEERICGEGQVKVGWTSDALSLGKQREL